MIKIKNAGMLVVGLIILPVVLEVAGNCAVTAKLYGVSVKLKNDREVSGFLAWNSGRVTFNEFLLRLNEFAVGGGNLPVDIVDQEPVALYRRFARIKYPIRARVVKKEDSFEIKFRDVAKIKERKELDLQIGGAGSEVPVIPEKDMPELNKEPIYIYSKGFYGHWREYFLAVSSSARVIDAVKYEAHYAKSIIFFGELIGNYDFSSVRVDCVGKSKAALGACNNAKKELEELKIGGQEVSQCKLKRENVRRLMQNTTAYPSVYSAPEYKEVEGECLELYSKYDKKYEPQLKYWGKAGFVHVRLPEIPR